MAHGILKHNKEYELELQDHKPVLFQTCYLVHIKPNQEVGTEGEPGKSYQETTASGGSLQI